MTPILSLATALTIAAVLMIAFAFFRRIMRSPSIPAVLDSTAVAFGVALILTTTFMASLMYVGFSVMPFVRSAALSCIATLVLHLGFWSLARLMVPLREQKVIVGKDIMTSVNAPPAGLPAN